MSSAVAQRQRALALYKRLVRTSQKTFEGDQRAIAAFGQEIRSRYRQMANETDPAKVEEALSMGEEVISVLRRNVVQGKLNEDSTAWNLRMTKETELGNNDSIKKAREQQIADLKAGKAPSRRSCREMAAEINSTTIFGSSSSSSSSSSSPAASGSARPFSTVAFAKRNTTTSPILRAAFSTTSATHLRDPTAVAATPLPRPAPKFSSVTILADGSSIELHTTSPRRLTRLTRDQTNHPLWNPSQERRVGGDGGDDSGRLGRFRRRFGDNEAAGPASSASAKERKEAAAAAAAQRGEVSFGQDDLDWMSVGGREARAGSPIQSKKAAKGKGKK
ncbi:uncharacterized protein PFL1_00061 [Pseudozyma flocculosa PF-1]|uniref:Mitochondrial zinc maintenance protein 1, mitochondrial n=1 Tax=Pseudozyma flocculosa TaxID=84751 RepID=A0A5C3EU81_9BASI|nr:uncharacterized protein PFL1_00061 [Pseudozyma flocculosa PF-1]EPQ31862.1 hypothetical protein PFL1_00061 [Pseudozyma flocculosa PF-1]SPO35235.1 related to MZM1 \